MPETITRRHFKTCKPYRVPSILSAVRITSVILAFAMFCVNLCPAVEPTPISTSMYQTLIGPGFATNWFKTEQPMKKYSEENIKDVHDKGFRNVRLRCRADLYSYDYTATTFTWFLGNLTIVVDDCLKHNVTPIISWIHHDAEAYATEEDREAYVAWWTAVARHLKDKDYKLSFNLFTELGIDGCGNNCEQSLRRDNDKYNKWTSEVLRAIRGTGGKNVQRILILGSPGKTAKDLPKINQTIYSNDSYTMAEWHIYASGPNKMLDGKKVWEEDGVSKGRQNVRDAISYATDFTNKTGLLTYLGAWMPQDNKNGDLREEEVINFARFFVTELRNLNIPWSLNVLDRYYDTKQKKWLTEEQEIRGEALNMSRVLDNIREVMP